MSGQPYGRYTLSTDGEPVPEPDLHVWAEWMETADRHLANDRLDDGTRVSTIFLGLDHAFPLIRRPILWETMIFGGPHDQYQERYASRDEALEGHAYALALAHGFLTREPSD
jgi:hypothetical protein